MREDRYRERVRAGVREREGGRRGGQGDKEAARRGGRIRKEEKRHSAKSSRAPKLQREGKTRGEGIDGGGMDAQQPKSYTLNPKP